MYDTVLDKSIGDHKHQWICLRRVQVCLWLVKSTYLFTVSRYVEM